jgi:hypothetical protein
MSGYNELFLKDPDSFAQLNALFPWADMIGGRNGLKVKTFTDKTVFFQIQNEVKVAWCNVAPANALLYVGGDTGDDYAKDIGLMVMRVRYDRDANTFPVYYLPWQQNRLFRMKLKPSPKNPTKLENEIVEPEIFITAALQGCSIIVSGDPEEPVVYHVNAVNTTGPKGENLNSETDLGFLKAAQAKRDHMLNLYDMARTQYPKEGRRVEGKRPEQTFVSKAVHLTDYMLGDMHTPNEALVARFVGDIGGSVDQFGTVFGVRSDRKWKFYRQTRTRVSRTGEIPKWLTPVCLPFWP